MGTKKTAIYIDGYNLYYGRLRGSAFKWLDLPLLFDALLKVQDPTCVVGAVKLFTAPALGTFASHGQDSVDAQDRYHRALSARHPHRFSIKLGNHSFDRKGALMPAFVDGQPHDRQSLVRVWRIEEKKTDVNIAMAMYRDACKGMFDPLREDFPAIEIGLVTPVRPPVDGASQRRFSASLAMHADWTRRYILDEELAGAQLPAIVPTRKKPIRKPAHW